MYSEAVFADFRAGLRDRGLYIFFCAGLLVFVELVFDNVFWSLGAATFSFFLISDLPSLRNPVLAPFILLGLLVIFPICGILLAKISVYSVYLVHGMVYFSTDAELMIILFRSAVFAVLVGILTASATILLKYLSVKMGSGEAAMSMRIPDFGGIFLFYFCVSGLFLLLHQILPHNDGAEAARIISNWVLFVFVIPFISSSIKASPDSRMD